MAKTKAKAAGADNIIEQRQRAMEKMSPALRKKLDWILEWQRTEHCHSLTGRWALGEQVNDVYKDMEQSGGTVYGQNAMGKLEIFMHEDKSVLSQARRLYLAYPDRKRLQEICEMVMQDQVTHLSYSHLRQLITIKDEQKRAAALNLTLENCWTSSDLGEHVQSINGGCQSNNPRGRAAIPKGAESVMDQQIAFADDFDKRNVNVWTDPKHSLSTQLDNMDPEEYTDELVQKLGQVAKRMRQVAEDAEKRAVEAEQRYTQAIRLMQEHARVANRVVVVDDDDEDTNSHLPDNPRAIRPVGRRVKIG